MIADPDWFEQVYPDDVQHVERFRWHCAGCGFEHISVCTQAEIDETIKLGAKCPNCARDLYAPPKLAEPDPA
jgi:hypothetical protein